MAKSRFSAQKYAAGFELIKTQILALSTLFAQQGTVVATWRKYGKSRLGPYFRLTYREGGVQRSIYLGRSEELAQEVGRLLAGLQFHRTCRRLRTRLRSSLRLEKTRLRENLHAHGYRMKGFEIHRASLNTENIWKSRSYDLYKARESALTLTLSGHRPKVGRERGLLG